MVSELSGAAHLALDGVELLSGAEHHQEQHDCDDEESGHECPPGCLNCHCAHAAVLAVSGRYEAHYQAVLIEPDLPSAPLREDVRPKQTARDSIYRPPRTHV